MVLVAAVLLAAGSAGLGLGRFERRLAVAQEDMAVLDFEDPQNALPVLEEQAARIPWVSDSTVAEIRRRRAELRYWQGDYADLAEVARTAPQEETPQDPEIRLVAANAAFRQAQQGPQDKATVLRSLDGVIRAYADALRAGAVRPDAAYNYELAVRLRAEIAGGKRKSLPVLMPVDETTDSNMHGDPGEPPKDAKMEQFQIRIPMDPKDFKSNQDQNAGTGQIRKRRG